MIQKCTRKIRITAVFLFMFLLCCGFDKNLEKVADNAQILTESEEQELRQMALEYADETKLDLAIITFTSREAENNMMVYTDTYYDEMGYGYDEAGSGVLLFINMYSREVYINTSGIGIWYLDDGDIQDILDDITPDLTKGNYYDACKCFLQDVRSLALQYVENEEEALGVWQRGQYKDYADFYRDYVVYHKDIDYTVHEEKSLIKTLLGNPISCGLISGGIAALIVLIMAYGEKSRMTANGATYQEAFDMTNQKDRFVRRSTVRHQIRSSSGRSGGGGGSFHSSGGGRSHGGGGGHF